jgi:hypothetical protein
MCCEGGAQRLYDRQYPHDNDVWSIGAVSKRSHARFQHLAIAVPHGDMKTGVAILVPHINCSVDLWRFAWLSWAFEVVHQYCVILVKISLQQTND